MPQSSTLATTPLGLPPYPFIMQVTLVSDITSDVMTFSELKFSLEKWHEGIFNVNRNNEKWGFTV